MEEYQREVTTNLKRTDKNLLLTNKDPHLSHLYGDDPKTPNSVDLDAESAFNDNDTKEPVYRLFEEQGGSYVPDFLPSGNAMMISPRENDLTINSNSSAGKLGFKTNLVKSNKTNRCTSDKVRSFYQRSDKKFTGETDGNLKLRQDQGSQVDDTATQSTRSTSVITSVGQTVADTVIPQSIMASTNAGISYAHRNNSANFNPESTQYNMDLLAHSAQLVLQTNTEDTQDNNGANEQSQGDIAACSDNSDVLRQLAMRVQIRTQQNQISSSPVYSSTSSLQKALSYDSKTKDMSEPQRNHRALHESKSEAAISNIDETPLLKDLLTGNNNTSSSSNKFNAMMQEEPRPVNFELGEDSKEGIPQSQEFMVQNNRGGQMDQSGMQSTIQQQQHPAFFQVPLQNDTMQNFSFPNNVYQQQTQIQQSNAELPHQYRTITTPLQSPNYAAHNPNEPQRYPQSDPSLTPTTPHHAPAFFPGVMGNQGMGGGADMQQDNSHSAFNELIAAAGEKLVENDSDQIVQDFIDEATGSSEDHGNMQNSNQMFLPDIQPNGQTPNYPQYPANNTEMQSINQQLNMINYPQDVKQEPQSPMLKSPHHSNHFFGSSMQHPGYRGPGLTSPNGMELHRSASQSNMQIPSTPTPEQHWPYSNSHSQSFTNPTPSPTAILSPNQVQASQQNNQGHIRTPSGNSTTRNNTDGSFSCNICGHSFRSMPALNGHRRVHSTTNDKKAKDDHRHRKLSGSHDIIIGSSSTPTMSIPSKSIAVTSHQFPPQYFGIPRYSHHAGLIPIIQTPTNPIKTEQGFHPQIRPQDPIIRMDYHNYPASINTAPSILINPYQQPPVFIHTSSTIGLAPQYIKPEELHSSLINDVSSGNIGLSNHQHPPHSVFVSSIPPSVEFTESQNQGFVPTQEPGYPAMNTLPVYFENQNRSTPLDDFADIAVAHKEGLLFSNDAVKNEFTGSNIAPRNEDQIKMDQPQANDENDVNALMESVSKDELLNALNTDELNKFNAQNSTDPYFPASVPVTVPQGYQGTFGATEIGLNDAMMAVDPSKILPNSMMGGNPGSSFKSFRQRHHSEGSMLKTIIPTNIPNIESLIDSTAYPSARKLQTDQTEKLKTAKKRPGPKPSDGQRNEKVLKYDNNTTVEQSKTPVANEKKEIWTVPKSVPAPKTRHRRHSADSRLSNPSLIRMPYYPIGFGKTKMSQQHRTKHKPPPLIIPASVNTFHPNNNPLYQSHLHRIRRVSGESANSGSGIEKIPPYTPPPMLSPMRSGPGLYYSTPQTPHKSLLSRQISYEPPIPATIREEDEFADERCPEPKINVGREYQAVLPMCRSQSRAANDQHKATLLWKPPKDIDKCKHMIEDYMNLACSAVVPFGGSNKEYALHLLHIHHGDVMACLRELLQPNPKVDLKHWQTNYLYTGSSDWSKQERQSFDKLMLQHRKDFFTIAESISSKSTSECVDYYYHTLKRRKRRIQRPRRYRHDSIEEVDKNEVEEERGDEVMQQMPQVVVPPDTSSMHNVMHQPTIDHNTRDATPPRPPPAIKINYSKPLPPMNNMSFPCHFKNCKQSFPDPQMLQKHQIVHKPQQQFIDRVIGSPSPANSPASTASTDHDQPQQMFTCPRCGKSFAKVKSRNAHMKTHGKHAQEKRKLKEEEAKKKEMEAARRKQERMLVSWEQGHLFNTFARPNKPDLI